MPDTPGATQTHKPPSLHLSFPSFLSLFKNTQIYKSTSLLPRIFLNYNQPSLPCQSDFLFSTFLTSASKSITAAVPCLLSLHNQSIYNKMAIIQDRTAEFHAHVKTLSRKIKRPPHAPGKAPLLSDYDDGTPVRKPSRSEFARKAADVGRAINDTMGKLERLAHCNFSPVLSISSRVY